MMTALTLSSSFRDRNQNQSRNEASDAPIRPRLVERTGIAILNVAYVVVVVARFEVNSALPSMVQALTCSLERFLK